MPNLLRTVALLITCSTCTGFCAGSSAVALASSRLPTSPVSLPRARTPVLKRSAEERDVLEMEGTVVEAMRGADFRVQLDEIDQVIVCKISGKIRKFRIKVLVGDRVTCEISPYDLTKGRITFRKR